MPIISLIGLGLAYSKLLARVKINLSVPEKIVYLILLVSAILVIPWSFAGLHKWTVFFQLWPLLLASLGLFILGIEIYRNFRLVILYLEKLNTTPDYLTEKMYEFGTANTILLGSIIVLLGSYTIFNMILPLRDFDAIWMYIPDAIWYYRMNYIPQLNPLNFNLSTKEPFVSLLFTYSLYITGSLNISLLPSLFVIGWSLTVYIFIDKIWHNRTKALMGVMLFLITPFMYYIFNFWVYYQEIYVSFFYAVTLLAVYSFFKIPDDINDQVKKRMELFYLLMGSLAFALSLLAKLSGWSLLFIIILVYPFSKKTRVLPTLLLVLVGLFLSIKVSITYYVGIGIAIVLYCLLLIYLIWQPRKERGGDFYATRHQSLVGLVMIPLGLVLGGFWLLDTYDQFHQYGTQLIDQYVALPKLVFKYTFQGTPLHSARFLLESAHSTDFVSIVLYLLIGNMFVLLWIVPKLRVVFDEQVKFFVLWTIGFFILWLTYQSFASIRYLSVILVPIVIIVTHGCYVLYEDITKVKDSLPLSAVAVACLVAFGSYYYPLNVSVLLNGITPKGISQQFLLSAYNYYHNSILYLLAACIASILFLLVLKWYRTTNYSLTGLKKFPKRPVKVLTLLMILFIPFLVPSVVFVSVQGNVQQFDSAFYYYQRPTYQEVVTELVDQNSPSSGIITLDDPGLPIYLNQPTLDLFNQEGNINVLSSTNITNLLQMLIEPLTYVKNNYNISIGTNILASGFSFDYFVIPNYGNNFYPYYAQTYYNSTYLFPLLFHKNLFQLIYENSDFLIFRREYSVPFFSGIVNSWLYTGTGPKDSVLGRIQNNETFGSSLQLQLLYSLPEALGSTVTLNTTMYITQGSRSILLNNTQTITLGLKNSFISATIPLTSQIMNLNSFSLDNITVNALINGTAGLVLRNYSLQGPTQGIPLIYNQRGQYWTITTGLGLQLD